MLSEAEATSAVKDLLHTTKLLRIDFTKISGERLDAPAVGPNEAFPMDIQVQFGEVEGGIVFRITISVERPDISAMTDMLVTFGVQNVEDWRDLTVLQVFGGHVAVPAAIPFARAKLREATSDMGTDPVLLGLYLPDKLRPVEDDARGDLADSEPVH